MPELGESGSEVSHFIPEPINFAEEYVKKAWSKETLKYIKNRIENQIFRIDYPAKEEPVTPCMDVYKVKNQSDGNLD